MLYRFPWIAALTAALMMPAPLAAADRTGEINGARAGLLAQRTAPCLLAQRTKQGPGCVEPALLTSGTSGERLANRIARARYFIDIENYDRARDELDIAIGIDPRDAEAHHLAGRLAMTLGDFERADRHLRTAHSLSPDNPDIHASYAQLFLSKEAPLESVREFSEILRKHPNHRFSRWRRANLAIQFRQYDAALFDLNVLIESDPGDLRLRGLRADVFGRLGRSDGAIADLTAILEQRPDQFITRIERARVFAQADMKEEALKDYGGVLTVEKGTPLYIMPGDMRAKLLIERAHILAGEKQFAAAASDAAAAIKIGGKRTILRVQIFLRGNGFPDLPISGEDSPALHDAIGACFGLNACFQGVMKSI